MAAKPEGGGVNCNQKEIQVAACARAERMQTETFAQTPTAPMPRVIGGVALSTIATPLSPLWPPHENSLFVCPKTSDEAGEVKRWLYDLQDGQMFACRGRDYELRAMLRALREDNAEALAESLQPQFTDWEYGVGIKKSRSVFLLWGKKVEKHDVGSLDLVSLLHICGQPPPPPQTRREEPAAAETKQAVVILCHGYSPDCGPGYPLLIILKNLLTQMRFTVILPDFRDTYAYGASRGRSERVCVVLEALLRARSQFPDCGVVLVGHSQGGAAAAQACRRSVVAHGCIQGLVMLGSESARERIRPPEFAFDGEDHENHVAVPFVEIYGQLPPGLAPSQILMMHSSRDPVISRIAIQQLVRR